MFLFVPSFLRLYHCKGVINLLKSAALYRRDATPRNTIWKYGGFQARVSSLWPIPLRSSVAAARDAENILGWNVIVINCIGGMWFIALCDDIRGGQVEYLSHFREYQSLLKSWRDTPGRRKVFNISMLSHVIALKGCQVGEFQKRMENLMSKT